MIRYKEPKCYNTNQIKRIREAGKVVKDVLALMAEECIIGRTTLEIDNTAANYLKNIKAKAASYGYKGYPRHSCISIDHAVVHGIPDDTIIQEGMLVGIDCPVKYKGMYADAAINVEVGKVNDEKKKLNKVSYDCLMNAIDKIGPGFTIGELCHIQQQYANDHGFKVIKQLQGHGIGKNLHESPAIPFWKIDINPYNDYKLKPGNVIAVEPGIVTDDNLLMLPDMWTIITEDRSPGTSWEHTILITDNGNEILTK